MADVKSVDKSDAERLPPKPKSYMFFKDGTTWVNPSTADDLNWRLRYAPHSITRNDQLTLASICEAYTHLMREASMKRVGVVRRQYRQHKEPA